MKRLWRKWKFYRHLRRLGHLASHRESWELAEANLAVSGHGASVMGSRTGENRPTRITKAYGPNVAELEARCVRAEEALRRAEDVIDAARTALEYPQAADARESLEMAIGAYEYVTAAVPEENAG